MDTILVSSVSSLAPSWRAACGWPHATPGRRTESIGRLPSAGVSGAQAIIVVICHGESAIIATRIRRRGQRSRSLRPCSNRMAFSISSVV